MDCWLSTDVLTCTFREWAVERQRVLQQNQALQLTRNQLQWHWVAAEGFSGWGGAEHPWGCGWRFKVLDVMKGEDDETRCASRITLEQSAYDGVQRRRALVRAWAYCYLESAVVQSAEERVITRLNFTQQCVSLLLSFTDYNSCAKFWWLEANFRIERI